MTTALEGDEWLAARPSRTLPPGKTWYSMFKTWWHTQKPDLVFQWNGRVYLNQRGCQFSQLLAVEECGSAESNCIDRVPTYSARLLATHFIRVHPLHFPSSASLCAIRFRTRYTHFTGGWVGPRASLYGRKISSPPGFDPGPSSL